MIVDVRVAEDLVLQPLWPEVYIPFLIETYGRKEAACCFPYVIPLYFKGRTIIHASKYFIDDLEDPR